VPPAGDPKHAAGLANTSSADDPFAELANSDRPAVRAAHLVLQAIGRNRKLFVGPTAATAPPTSPLVSTPSHPAWQVTTAL